MKEYDSLPPARMPANTFLTLCLVRSAGDHVNITLDPIGASALGNEKLIREFSNDVIKFLNQKLKSHQSFYPHQA